MVHQLGRAQFPSWSRILDICYM